MKRLLLDATLIVAVVGWSNFHSERAGHRVGEAEPVQCTTVPLRWEFAPRAPRLSVASGETVLDQLSIPVSDG